MISANTKPSRKMRHCELLAIATELGIPGIYGTSKDMLCILIRRAQTLRASV